MRFLVVALLLVSAVARADDDDAPIVQDMKFVDGRLVASGLLPGRAGAIDWLEYPSLRLIRRLPVGQSSRGISYSSEGMAVRGDRLLLLPEDSPSRLFEFRLDR